MSDLPKTNSPIQTEATRFRSAVSESLLQLIGGDINYLLAAVQPVGSVVASMLTLAQYQDEASDDWVLADGQAVPGSTYELVTGQSNVPDLRGVFLRGKNNGRSGSSGNPDGDSALGTYQADELKSHSHTANALLNHLFETVADGTIEKDAGSEYRIDPDSAYPASVGGNETRARNVTVNYFIRIN